MAYNQDRGSGGFNWDRVGEPAQGYGGGGHKGGNWARSENTSNYNRGGRGGNRGGGGGGGGYNNRPTEPIDPRKEAEDRLKSLVVNLADDPDAKDPESNLARVISRDYASHGRAALTAFRAAISSLPHKAGNYAALVGLVGVIERGAESEKGTGMALDGMMRTVVQSVEEAMRDFEWFEMVTLLRFFSSLVSLGITTPHSHILILNALLNPLTTHPASSYTDSLAFIALEGLPLAAATLWGSVPAESEAMWSLLEKYVGARTSRTVGVKYYLSEVEGDALDVVFEAVSNCKASNWDVSFLPDLKKQHPKLDGFEAVTLPGVEGLKMGTPGETVKFPLAGAAPLWIFDDDSMNVEPVVHHLPGTSTYARHFLRTTTTLLLRHHTENRKPAVTALMSLPRLYNLPSLAALESGIEAVVADVLHLPDPRSGPIYQNSIMCEFLASNPKEIAPLFGRCVRRWFERLDEEGGDVGTAKRGAEYLAVHLSNFSWKWSWDRWLPMLQLERTTARSASLRHFLSQMIRLSYWDHIREALPESWHSALPPAPVTSFRYDPATSTLNPELCNLANEVVSAFRNRAPGWMDSARASIEAVRTWARANPELAASSLPASTEAPTTQPEIEDALARDITLQAILLLGSKSISHVLNALERSLPVLRDLFPDHRYASDPAAVKAMKQGLRAAWDVNQMSEQMGEIVVDKLLNYRVLDAGVVCGWVLERAEEGGFAEFWIWNVLLSTLAKVVLRVRQITSKLEASRAQMASFPPKFGADGEMDAEDEKEGKVREEVERFGKMLSAAQRDEKEAFGSVFKKFAQMLKDHIAACQSNGENPELTPFWRFTTGFMREVERTFADAIRGMLVTIETLAFDGGNEYGTAIDPRIWQIWAEVKAGVIARRIV